MLLLRLVRRVSIVFKKILERDCIMVKSSDFSTEGRAALPKGSVLGDSDNWSFVDNDNCNSVESVDRKPKFKDGKPEFTEAQNKVISRMARFIMTDPDHIKRMRERGQDISEQFVIKCIELDFIKDPDAYKETATLISESSQAAISREIKRVHSAANVAGKGRMSRRDAKDIVESQLKENPELLDDLVKKYIVSLRQNEYNQRESSFMGKLKEDRSAQSPGIN